MQSITTRLTATIVDNAKVGATEYFLWDENTKGFGVRVRPTGVKSWIVQFRVGKGREAQQRRVTIGKVSNLKLAAAKLRASQYLGKAAFAEDMVEEIAEKRRSELSVNDAIDMWVKEAAPLNRRTGAPRTPANIKVDVDRLEIHVRPVLGTKRLSRVTKADIEVLRDTIASGRTASKKKTKARGVRNAPGGAGTAARAIRVLSSVFAHAEDHELISRNPCRGVKLQPSNKCERFLTRDEARRLGEVLDRWDKLGKSRTGVGVIRMLTLTGARSSEITGLKWSQIDFDQGFLRLDKSKTGKSIRPLSGVALQFLRDWPRQHKTWVFPSATGGSAFQGIQKDWRAIRQEASIEDVRIHDLRHSFASFGVAAGLSLPVIGALLGHKDVSTTQRYAHLANDSARRAANDVADLVANAMGMTGG